LKEEILKRHKLLIEGISQYEVDFVIPYVGADIPLGIDPFLLYKSRDPKFAKLHSQVLDAFNYGVNLVRHKRFREAESHFKYPEVKEIGFGYSKTTKEGAGVGEYLTSLIIQSLNDSPDLLARGIKHIEEMQLISYGIRADRISDTIANLIKSFLIEYTQTQCGIWGIKLYSGVPVENIFDFDKGEWYDDYVDLPLSPFNEAPIIFVPRRIVRTLPWINYDDYFRSELKPYLKAQKTKREKNEKTNTYESSDVNMHKSEAAILSRRLIEKIDSYIFRKERDSSQAQPSLNYVDTSQLCPQAEALKEKLDKIKTGREEASAYQHTVLEILNYLFNPELIDGKPEVATIDGTERRDIIFTNDSDQSFWEYLRNEHSSFLIMFEIKNTTDVTNNYLAQTRTYLGDRLGRLGFIVSRNGLEESQIRKTYSIYNDSSPRIIILGLSDSDLKNMLTQKCEGKNPMEYVRTIYRNFRTSVQ
jgi:hypothetical protein